MFGKNYYFIATLSKQPEKMSDPLDLTKWGVWRFDDPAAAEAFNERKYAFLTPKRAIKSLFKNKGEGFVREEADSGGYRMIWEAK